MKIFPCSPKASLILTKWFNAYKVLSSLSTSTIRLTSVQNVAMNKAIIEFTDPTDSCGLVKNRLKRSSRFEDVPSVFYEND